MGNSDVKSCDKCHTTSKALVYTRQNVYMCLKCLAKVGNVRKTKEKVKRLEQSFYYIIGKVFVYSILLYSILYIAIKFKNK